MSELRLEKLKVFHLGPVDLTVKAGEIVCVSGESGAGKSLLLRADIIPHGGQVFLDDRSSLDYTAPQWRKQVALLPAESQWWQDLVATHFSEPNNVNFQQLGLEASAIKWQVSRCSTGEKQRLAILRLLANRPKCLLLDEPTGSLDPENTKRVETLVKKIAEQDKLAVMWVSHSEEQIKRIADRHFVVRDGGLFQQ